jgi:RNA polymerase sigma-70 factor (ECF subfamily)
MSTDDLVRRAQQGDTDAYELLYRELVDRIYAVCLRMTADSDRATELTQDTFIRAWEKLSSFRGASQFSTWVHRIAVNMVLQDRRSRSRREKTVSTTDDLERYGAAAAAAMPGTRIDIERALATLPPKAREVLVLRDVKGYKYREVADLTGTAVGTVKAQVHRARRLMRDALDA